MEIPARERSRGDLGEVRVKTGRRFFGKEDVILDQDPPHVEVDWRRWEVTSGLAGSYPGSSSRQWKAVCSVSGATWVQNMADALVVRWDFTCLSFPPDAQRK